MTDDRLLAGGRVVLFGGGDHARSVNDVLERAGVAVAAVVDRRPSPEWGRCLTDDDEGVRVALDEQLAAVIAIGDNRVRLGLVERLRAAGVPVPTLVAGSATVSRTAVLGPGTVVLEHAHVGPATVIGAGVVVNTAAVVEHDCRLGDGTHCAPRSVLGGGASAGHRALVGIGATVAPRCHVGDDAVVGAGAVVVRDVPDGATQVGVPAHRGPAPTP